jgi:hypothetical protein
MQARGQGRLAQKNEGWVRGSCCHKNTHRRVLQEEAPKQSVGRFDSSRSM